MAATSRSHGERGFSLVELLVVIVILGAIGSVVVAAVARATETSSTTAARIEAIQELEIAVQRVSREIRAAAPLEVPTVDDPENNLAAWVRRDGEWGLREFRIEEGTEGTVLVAESFAVESVDDEGGECGTVESTASQRLVTRVDNEDGAVFTYLDQDGKEIIPPDDYTRAVTVEVRLVREIPEQRPIEVSATTAVRSIRYGGTVPCDLSD